MSLTSYRAAPPRVKGCVVAAGCKGEDGQTGKARRLDREDAPRMPVWCQIVKRGDVVLGRSGNDLLSRVLRHSTIGAEEFNGRVRDGIGFWRLAQITGPAKDNSRRQGTAELAAPGQLEPRWIAAPQGRTASRLEQVFAVQSIIRTDTDHKSDQANRAISTSQLNASPRLHTWPINVVVFHGSQGSTRFEGGFPLRCLQRLSRPYIATLHCGWRHNSSTRGTSIPVLSY